MALKTSNKNRKKESVIELSTAEMWEIGMIKEWKPIDELAPHEHRTAQVNTNYTSTVDRYVKEHHLKGKPKRKTIWYVVGGIVLVAVLFLI